MDIRNALGAACMHIAAGIQAGTLFYAYPVNEAEFWCRWVAAGFAETTPLTPLCTDWPAPSDYL